MLLVVVLLAFFCVVGLAARRFSTNVRLALLAGAGVLVVLDLVRRVLQ